MLDPTITELARTMIQVQFEERRRQLEREVELVHNEMAARRIGRSGIALSRIHDLCAREVEIRAHIVWQVLARVLSTIGFGPSETVAQDLKAEVEAYLPPDLPELNQIIARNANLIRAGQVPPLTDARNHALRKIGAEIDLFVLSLERHVASSEAQTAAPQATYQFYSPIGVLQTGAGATAQVVQILSTQDREALLRTLDDLRQGLEHLAEVPGHSRDEVLELVGDARSEAEKPEPNVLRLRTILLGLATTIQTIGSLQPAYQAIKGFLLQFGIQLP